MEKGFYTWEKEEDDFSFLEELEVAPKIDLYDFLHGFCCSFVKALNDVYGYPVHVLYNEEGEIVHAYCVITQKEISCLWMSGESQMTFMVPSCLSLMTSSP